VERIFPPEFRNRLDGIVPFNQIDESMAKRIARKALERLKDKLAKQGVIFEVTDAAEDSIAAKGFSAQFGAREIIRTVENDVKKILVDEVLFGNKAAEDKVILDVSNEGFVLR
jgi:ATP-dependent Clp protease ATP-binding subunit ClpA